MAKIRHVKGNLYTFYSPAVAKKTAESLFLQGTEAEKAGKLDEALDFYHKSLNSDPKYEKSYLNIGTILFHKRRYDEAEQYYQKAVKANPSYALAHYNLANCLTSKYPPQTQDAIKHYLIALEINPKYGDAHFNLAIEYRDMNVPRSALKHFRLYLKCDDTNSDRWKRIAEREIAKLDSRLSS